MNNLFGDDITEDITADTAEVDKEFSTDDEDLADNSEVTPRSNQELYGHEDIESKILNDFNQGRLPHAIALCGASGIGKATLAYRIAKFLLSRKSDDNKADSLFVPNSNPSVKRVLSKGHADLMVIEREYDEKKGRYKNDISVESIRKIHPFLSKTAAEGGWRVVIIDGAEALNRSSQNAILKVLEEAPSKTVIILTTSQPGSFLPTIKSRCRMINMLSLSNDIINKLIDTKLPNLNEAEKTAIVKISDGSIGAAIDFYNNDGAGLYNEIMSIIAQLPDINLLSLYQLSEKFQKPNTETLYEIAFNILLKFCEEISRNQARGYANDFEVPNYPKDHFLNAWENISKVKRQIENFNLDKQQGIIKAFMAMQDCNFEELKL